MIRREVFSDWATAVAHGFAEGGFTYGGMSITNPFVSTDARFEADPCNFYGFVPARDRDGARIPGVYTLTDEDGDRWILRADEVGDEPDAEDYFLGRADGGVQIQQFPRGGDFVVTTPTKMDATVDMVAAWGERDILDRVRYWARHGFSDFRVEHTGGGNYVAVADLSDGGLIWAGNGDGNVPERGMETLVELCRDEDSTDEPIWRLRYYPDGSYSLYRAPSADACDHAYTWSDDGREMICDYCARRRPPTPEEVAEFARVRAADLDPRDLDAVLATYQDALGVTDGGYAGIWWDEPKRTLFATGSEAERHILLSDYIAAELAFILPTEEV